MKLYNYTTCKSYPAFNLLRICLELVLLGADIWYAKVPLCIMSRWL